MTDPTTARSTNCGDAARYDRGECDWPKCGCADESPADLWCVHILGPDDVIAYPDRASAEHDATLINEAMAQHVARNPPADSWPLLRAAVELWPHNAESHAEDLARNIRLEERDGNA